MKGVIFHNKAENEVYMVHSVAGEFATNPVVPRASGPLAPAHNTVLVAV